MYHFVTFELAEGRDNPKMLKKDGKKQLRKKKLIRIRKYRTFFINL